MGSREDVGTWADETEGNSAKIGDRSPLHTHTFRPPPPREGTSTAGAFSQQSLPLTAPLSLRQPPTTTDTPLSPQPSTDSRPLLLQPARR